MIDWAIDRKTADLGLKQIRLGERKITTLLVDARMAAKGSMKEKNAEEKEELVIFNETLKEDIETLNNLIDSISETREELCNYSEIISANLSDRNIELNLEIETVDAEGSQ